MIRSTFTLALLLIVALFVSFVGGCHPEREERHIGSNIVAPQ